MEITTSSQAVDAAITGSQYTERWCAKFAVFGLDWITKLFCRQILDPCI